MQATPTNPPPPPPQENETTAQRIFNFDPYNRPAWAWFFAQATLQLYAATYFGCMAKLAILPKGLEWLLWPTIIASAGVNYLLHITCGQASYHLLEDYYHQAKTILNLYQNNDMSSYHEATSLGLELLTIGSIAGLSVIPFISIDEDIEGVCPFFSGKAVIPLTLLSFFWVGFPASATALPWISAPFNTLCQTIASSLRLTDYFPSLGQYWARKSTALPLDDIQATIHQKLNRVYWNRYDLQGLRDPLLLTPEIDTIDRIIISAAGDLSTFGANEKQDVLQAFLRMYEDNRDDTAQPASRAIELTLFLLVGWLSYFPYFIPTAQDKELHPSIILASILVCSFLCLIAARSVSSIFHSFFPKRDEQYMASYFYRYRTLSYTLSGIAIALIIAAFLSAAPCFGLSQEKLLDHVPEHSWFSTAVLFFFVMGTMIFNFAFCADSLQEVANTYYTIVETDNITARHVWAQKLLQTMIKGLQQLPPEESKEILGQFINEQRSPYEPEELEQGLSFNDSSTDRTNSSGADSILTDEEKENAERFSTTYSDETLQYTPPDRMIASAQTIAMLLALGNAVAASRLYQQTQHGMEVYAVNLGISILCHYLIPRDFSLERLGKVTCGSLLAIAVGFTLDQGFLTYLLGSLTTNTWWLNPNEGNDVISKGTSLGIGLITAALYSPHATKLTQDYLSQRFDRHGN